jgi:hypothetical protein
MYGGLRVLGGGSENFGEHGGGGHGSDIEGRGTE